MINIRELSDKHYEEVYGWKGSNPYGSELDFAISFRALAECGVFVAKAEARRQWLLRDIYEAQDLNDIKSILEQIVNGES